MSKKIEIFKNYGCLAAEKSVIYTYARQHATAVCSDKIVVKIPDGWDAYENTMGELTIVSPDGATYTPAEILFGNEEPCFMGFDKSMNKFVAKLEVL